MNDEDYSSLETEIETLKAIYIHELEVNHDDRGRPSCVIVHLYPATADNVTEQFVRLSLILRIPSEYPLDIPEISIRNTRGLSDEEIESIYEATQALAKERKGNALLFELIEVAKEHLTGINIPSCECAICLYGFVSDDILTKTECFHYFHSHCLARYVHHTLKEKKDVNEEIVAKEKELDLKIACPVCRLPVSFLLSDKKFPPPAESENVDISISMEQRKFQEEMQELFVKQKEKGGIIDLEAEKNKFLLEISAVPDSAVNNSDTETANQQIEQCIMKIEHKDSRLENVKTTKVSSELLSRSEENHLGESPYLSNEDNNRYLKPFRHPHKQRGTFSSRGERDLSSEESLESINSTKDNSKNQHNGSRKQEIMLGNDEVHLSGAVDDDIEQEKAIAPCEQRYRTMQRGKMLHQRPSRRPFRGNRYPRQVQNRVRHVYDKTLQTDKDECKNETEKYVSRQSSINYISEYSNREGNRKLDSNKDTIETKETETNSRPESSRADTNIYRERRKETRYRYSGRHDNRFQRTEERGESSREHKNELVEEEGRHWKTADMSRKTENEGRHYSPGKYTGNYRSDQRFRNYQRRISTEGTQIKGNIFQDQTTNSLNIKYDDAKTEQPKESSLHETIRRDNETMKVSHRNTLYEKDMLQNQNKSKESNLETDLEYTKRDRRSGNYNKRYNSRGRRLEHNRIDASDGRKLRQDSVKEYSENGNLSQVQTDYSNNMNKEVNLEVSRLVTDIQKMAGQTKSNEVELEDTSQPLIKDDEGNEKEEKSKNVNVCDDNNYKRRYSSHRGFRNRANDRQYRYSCKGRDNYNGKSVSEQLNFEHRPHPNINQTQIASKNKVNKEFSTEVSKHSFHVQKITIDLQLNKTEFEDTLQLLEKDEEYEERCKNTNARDRNNYRGRPRNHRGFRYRTNERYSSGGEDNYNGESITEQKKFESRDNSKQLAKQMKQPQDSNNSDIIETEADKHEEVENMHRKQNYSGSNDVSHTFPRKNVDKASTKRRNLYFYPRSRGNYWNNNNRTTNKVNYQMEEGHRDSKGSNILTNSKDKIESVDTYKTEAEEHTSHR